MTTMESSPEFRDLLAQLCEGELTAAEAARIEQLATADPAARGYYVRYMDLHGTLRRYSVRWIGVRGGAGFHVERSKANHLPKTAPSEASTWSDDLLADSIEPAIDIDRVVTMPADSTLHSMMTQPTATPSSRSPVLGFLGNIVTQGPTLVGRPLVLAIVSASVVLGAVLAFWATREPRPIAQPNPQLVEPVNVAKITKLSNAKWNPSEHSFAANDELTSGQQLRLLSGAVEVEFASGATMLVAGPATLQLESMNVGRLDEGRALANVPQRAKGFTIRTPSMEIVDLGTEFGVDVNRLGSAEVHVLKGTVEVAPTVADRTASRITLSAGSAAKATAGKSELTTIAADMHRFQQIAAPPRPAVKPLIALVHYRLGEDDDEDTADTTVPRVGKLSLQSSAPIHYAADTETDVSQRAVRFGAGATESLVSTTPLPESAENWVLEAWVRPRDLKNSIVVFNGRPGGDGFGLLLVDGKWAAAWGNDNFLIEKASSCVVGDWMHLALVRQEDKGAMLWINGVRADVRFVQGLQVPVTDNFCVGGCSTASEEGFEGEIDEVRWSQLPQAFDPAMLLRKPREPKD